jgi:hypothetical protein
MTDNRIPPAALWLGLAGLIPFAACAGAVVLGRGLPVVGDPARALVGYGAVILSFLGGVRWGLALRMPESPQRALQLAIAVAPSIAGWFVLLSPAPVGTALLAVLFVILWSADRRLAAIGAPAWYPRLRAILTAGATAALAAAAWAAGRMLH